MSAKHATSRNHGRWWPDGVAVAASVLIVLGAGPEANAERGPDFAVPGARARAMGGAFTAVASDLSAFHWNPAGLAGLEQPTVQAETRLTFGSATPTAVDELVSPAGVVPVLEFTASPGTELTYYLIGAGTPLFAERVPVPLVGAFGYRRVIDLLYSQSQVFEFDAGGNTIIPLEFNSEGEGGFDAYTFSVAASPVSQVQLGINVNVLDGEIESLEAQEVTVSGLNVFQTAVAAKQSVSGFSFELGARIRPHAMVELGAVLRPGFDADLEDGKLRTRAFIAPGAPGLEPINIDITEALPDERLEFPTFYSLGIALRPLPKLLLAGDWNYEPWNETASFVQSGGETVRSDPRFYQTHSIHVGGEYLFQVGSVGVPVRGGFQTAPTVRANIDSLSVDVGPDGFRSYRGERIDGNTISFGTGIHFATVHFDVAYDRTSYSVSDFQLSEAPIPGQPVRLVEIDETRSSLYFTSTLRY